MTILIKSFGHSRILLRSPDFVLEIKVISFVANGDADNRGVDDEFLATMFLGVVFSTGKASPEARKIRFLKVVVSTGRFSEVVFSTGQTSLDV